MDKDNSKNTSAEKETTKVAKAIIALLEGGHGMYTVIDRQNSIPYVVIKRGESVKAMRVRSADFNTYVSHVAWDYLDTAISPQLRSSIIEIVESMAKFGSSEVKDIHLRTAYVGDVLWYDLGDGRAVKVTGDGWSVIANGEILFRQYSHQLPQLEPQTGGSLDLLKPYLNLNTKEPEKAWLLLRTYIVAALLPDIARPILVLHGQQGSAKSTFFRVIKSVIDPSSIDVLTYPSNQKELIQTLSHHFLVYFDNLSHLTEKDSDDLCRACTGQAFSKRALYSDDEDIIYNYRRAIGINGINLVSTKPDLLDRCLIFDLEPIQKSERMKEGDLWLRFDSEKPLILGAIFDALSSAIKLRGEKAVVLEQHPRLADYAEWCAAINMALGGTIAEFADAYDFNVGQQTDEALENSMLAQVIVSYMRHKSESQSSAAELYEYLKEHADMIMGVKAGDGDFPKNQRMLYKRMRIIKGSLQAIGIDFRYLKTERPRKIVLTNSSNATDSEEAIDQTQTTEASSAPITEVVNEAAGDIDEL